MRISKVQRVISGLNRFWARLCLLVAALLLVELGKATVPIPRAGEKDDVETLLHLENDMAQAWVQRDTETLVRTLADDYTLSGTGDFLIDKGAYVAGLDNPEFRATSAMVALNQPRSGQLVLDVRVVDRSRDEAGDAKGGLHDDHGQQ